VITVHHLEHSRSQRVIWLLEELSVPYEIQNYQRDPVTRRAPDALKAIHPLGKSPVISEGNTVIAESGLIVEYLCARFDSGVLSPPSHMPADTPEKSRWLYWVHYAEGSPMAPLLMKLMLGGIAAPELDSLKIGFIDHQITDHVDFWNNQLARTGWFAGADFSAADIMMGFALEIADKFGFINQDMHVTKFLAAIKARPAYIRSNDTLIDIHIRGMSQHAQNRLRM
jgi:glutathione S-transferase